MTSSVSPHVAAKLIALSIASKVIVGEFSAFVTVAVTEPLAMLETFPASSRLKNSVARGGISHAVISATFSSVNCIYP